jgi:hypothetical protein
MSLYVVVLNVNPGITIADVQSHLNGSRNVNGSPNSYYRIANNVWIVEDELGEIYLYKLLEHFARPSGTLFISRLNARENRGFMVQDFWDWLKVRVLKA